MNEAKRRVVLAQSEQLIISGVLAEGFSTPRYTKIIALNLGPSHLYLDEAIFGFVESGSSDKQFSMKIEIVLSPGLDAVVLDENIFIQWGGSIAFEEYKAWGEQAKERWLEFHARAPSGTLKPVLHLAETLSLNPLQIVIKDN